MNVGTVMVLDAVVVAFRVGGDPGDLVVLVALFELAETRGEFTVAAVVAEVGDSVGVMVAGVGSVEDGEKEKALFGSEDCCLRRRGSLDMPSERES